MAGTPLLAHLFPLRHAGLLRQLWLRDLHNRYRQSWLGTLWMVLTPLAMLTVYTLVFRHVMQMRWPGGAEGDLAFALRVYAGLAVFLFFNECVNRAPTLVIEQVSLVKRVVFPLELLPWVSTATAAAGLAVAAVLLAGLALISGEGLHPTTLLLPLVWLPLLPWVLGLGWLLSAIGTYVRDIGQVLNLATSALMFLSPVFFPFEALPEAARPWLRFNPLAPVMGATRDVLAGRTPDVEALAWVALAGTGVAVLGALFFRRVRPGFADVV
jgi:lipopolysaccharide transport system permease protein